MQRDIGKIAEALNDDGTVIIPTDTIYGFSCQINSEKAINNIRKLKKRDNKPFLILDSEISRVKKYFEKSSFTAKIIDLLITEDLWPNNITLIAVKSEEKPFPFLDGIDTVAVRYTNHHLIKKISSIINDGILSTSINITGEKEIIDYLEIQKKYEKKVDYIYETVPKENQICKSSVIIKLDEKKQSFDILREGDPKIGAKLYSIKKKLDNNEL